jgi:FkbM family methyltransferase
VDIGAHVGFFTLIGAHCVGNAGRVHAFEPASANFSTLERNVRQNGIENVTLIRAAVTTKSGEVALGLDLAELVGKSTGDYTIGGAHASFTASAVSLDDYLQEVGESRRLRLIKMDVEGLEPEVLAGAQRTLAELPPDGVLFEQNAALLRRRGHAAEAVIEQLERHGYSFHRIDPLGRLRRIDQVSEDVGDQPGHRSRLAVGLATRQTLFNVLAVRKRDDEH